ncbi:MAG TPA: hypothetical protein PKX93_08580, partial [bacterium]|nr:hypothetical protein [bacterium]
MPSSHSLISWFLKKRSLLRTAREANLSGEIYSLSELLGGQFFFPLLTTRGSLSGFLSLGGKLTGE